MTKVMVEGFGWVYLVRVLAWYTTQIVGYDAGVPCTARHGLAALDMAVSRQFPTGARAQGVSWMRAHGCQPTALAVMKACRTWGMQPAFTSDNPPKGKAATERVRQTLTEAGLWLQEWTSPLALIRALEVWIADDNEHDLHSALGYQSPRPLERHDYLRHGTPFVAA
jgi:putative transposase